ncbi:MAG: sigma-54-dependent Fis family transcriptional regulator [Rhodanobacteraceae bacterium]|nr:sigma-54-dependent Fis family transcriptional regulator [Rhodanobacteraceae bacterium]
MTPSFNSPSIEVARRAFFEQRGMRAGQVPETILQSWTRCQRLGLAAERRLQLEPVAQAELKQMRERNERLWRLARAELDGLAAGASANGSMVILTDDQGWILDAGGHPKFLDRAGRVALAPGACWNETLAGTNAIGTAIAEARSVEVRGGEHYLAPHSILSCSAAPIFDPYGQLVGVLDISGDSRVPQVHALGLAQLAVSNIEHRFFDDGIGACEVLRVHRDPALLGTAREGVLAFRGGQLIAANQIGLQLLGLGRGDLGRVAYDHLFADTPARLRDRGTLSDQRGRTLHGRVDDRADARPRRPAAYLPAVAQKALGSGDALLFDELLESELARACRVIQADLPVLVHGETGTGKEVFARELHRRCCRAGKPFVAINCAAIPEGLIEAELFGYEDGAFTGARRHGNPGLLRQAEGGVLFLDEIGDMPLALQPRLLRVLQERELSPLGGGKAVKLDFALVCATHRNLEEAIAEGRFRADLYYRIAHHGIHIAPLRAHPDLPGLIDTLWRRLADGRRLSDPAVDALSRYRWPGNLRQLVACLRTLVALSDPGELIDLTALPGYLRVPSVAATANPQSAAPTAAGELNDITTSAMRQALAACGGNVVQAARKLGISRSTLYRRLGLKRT